MTELKVIALVLLTIVVIAAATWLFLKGADDDHGGYGY